MILSSVTSIIVADDIFIPREMGLLKTKRTLCICAALCFALSAVFGISFTALASDISFSYAVETATLTVEGSGEIENYTESTIKSRPWNLYKDEAKHIVIKDGITAVGDYAFAQFKYAEDITVPSSVTAIGTAAFVGADSITDFTVPDSVETVGDYAFGFDENIEILPNFVAHCSAKSAAQAYCFKNQIMFDTPIAHGTSKAHITVGGEQQLWSFVPLTDGTITFYSTGAKDTFGFLYDAQNYTYSTSFSELRKTALRTDDDSADGQLNFKITAAVEAGKRYYLGARFRTNSVYDGSKANEDGTFGVVFAFACNEHRYALSSTTQPTCTEPGYNTYTCVTCDESYNESIEPLGHDFAPASFDGTTVSLKCTRCDETSTIDFAENYHADLTDQNRMLDANSDGIINAKDYAILYKM